jgi:tetratricopeptide (TPR) repeat protein
MLSIDVSAAIRSVVVVVALAYTLGSLWARRPLFEPLFLTAELHGPEVYQWYENFLDAGHMATSGLPKRAEAPLHRVLDEVPEHWAASQLLGDVLLEQDVNAASNAYLDATAADSGSSIAVYRLGQACGEMGDLESMRGQCLQAIWLNPRNGAALRCLARGLMLSRLETSNPSADTALSLRYLARAMSVDPSDVRAALQYCDQLLVHGADAAAEACLEDLMREHSKYIDVLMRLALLSMRHDGILGVPGWMARGDGTAADGGRGATSRGLLEVVAQAATASSDRSPHGPAAAFVLAESEAAMLQTVHSASSKHMELERWWMWVLPLIARFKLFALDYGLPMDACLARPWHPVASRYPQLVAASEDYFRRQRGRSSSSSSSSNYGYSKINGSSSGLGGYGTAAALVFESPALSVLESSPLLDQAAAHFIEEGLGRWFPDSTCSLDPGKDDYEEGEGGSGASEGSGAPDGCSRRLFCLDVGAGRGTLSAALRRRCLVLTAMEQAVHATFAR